MRPIYKREIPRYCREHFEKTMFNKRFGHLRILGISDQTDSTNVHFCICICDCGRIFHTRKRSIQTGRTKSCCDYVSIEEERERFQEKIFIESNDCWLWKGFKYKRNNGNPSYGRFQSKLFPDEYLAHRLSFLLYKGDIPENMFVCHICDVESCVNPDHLFLGNREANSIDMVVKERSLVGEKNPNCKWDEATVLKVRELHSEGNSYSEISKLLSIPKSTVSNFLSKGKWGRRKHV